MMLAFLVDQVEQRCCGLFRKAREKAGRPLYFWQKLRSLVLDFEIPDWEYVYKMIVSVRSARDGWFFFSRDSLTAGYFDHHALTLEAC